MVDNRRRIHYNQRRDDGMEAETTLAAGIRAADEESNYDAVCKELLSEKIIST